jgi:acyl carrier protein
MISDRLKRIILKELNLSEWEMSGTTEASQVPGWDSLNHVRILTAVEKEFGIRFKTLEVLRLRNVGDLQKAIDLKMKK